MLNHFLNILEKAGKLDFPAMLDEVEQLQLLQDVLLIYFIYEHFLFLFMYCIAERHGAPDIEFFMDIRGQKC